MKLLYISNVILLYISFISCFNLNTVICEYDDIDQDTSYDKDSFVKINCNNETCNVNGEGASFSDSIITINEQGTFVIEGSLNGQLVVETDEEAVVHIIFDNAIISSSVGPALFIAAAEKVYLTIINENILNSLLKDVSDNTVILSNSALSINGTGSLKLENTYGELINCNKDLKLVTGEIIINSSDINKIQAKNSFCIKDTVFNILNNNNSIYSSKTIPTSKTIPETTNNTIPKTTTSDKTIPKNTTSNKTIPKSSGKTVPVSSAAKTVPKKDTQPTNSSCSNTIQRMGYKCCRSNCRIIYVDRYGNWGSENNKWCGCGGGPKCSQMIINKGYRCCQSDNCSIKHDDIDGEWGVDQKKKAWCGIRYSCHDKKRK